jgi:2-amino-4-hydroxy-6-hydroxymethyldihydropteridine diphosphokinase
MEISKSSAVYQTKPWGYLDQPDFLNLVLEAWTDLKPRELLDHIKEIEKEIGREPSFKYGPRMVDIDILVYGDLIIQEDGLVIPHPRMAERAFVLVPLVEIAPNLCVPGLDQSTADLLAGVDQSEVSIYQE